MTGERTEVVHDQAPLADRYRDHPALGFIDWNLRGIGQVVFQNNPLSGLIILLALFFNSWIYGAVCLLGVAAATTTAILLRADRGLIRDGLFGFNGALVGLALVAFTSADFGRGAVPSPHMAAYIVFAAAMTTIVFQALSALLAPHGVAALTGPFVLIGWLFLFGMLKFAALDAGPLAQPAPPEQYAAAIGYGLPTWYMGIGNAIGQIFFQDNWISGYLIAAGIAVNSRIAAGMALIGAAGAALSAAAFGGAESAIRDGLFGYNAALVAMALGGVFLVLTWRSFLYALFGVVVSTWLWASVTIFLAPIGMPPLTSAFVLVTWLMLLGRHGFKALIPVPPAEATTPEDNRRRHLAGHPALSSGGSDRR